MKPHPWFNSPVRRVVTALLIALWLVLELWAAPSSIWTFIAGGALAYAIWDFYLAGHYPMEDTTS